MSKIELRKVIKLFGRNEAAGLEMARQGASKAEILKATGCNLALRDVSLEIPTGEVCVLMGLSGSGKSTLVRHINRLIEPTAGDISVDAVDVRALDAAALREFRRRRISMVFQGFGLLPHLDVMDNVNFGLVSRGEATKQANEKAMHWINDVGLSGYQHARIEALSGGMKQRVGLARALAVDTDIMLMDEAFSALDPLTRGDMQDLLIGLQTRLNKTIIFVTHNLDEAVRLGNRIVIIKDGEIVQSGMPEEIMKHPADDYVARFVQIWNR